MQAVEYRLVQLRAYRLKLNLFDNLLGEAVRQEVSREVVVQAAAQEVEKLLLFELANGRAVRALHVVVVDFELRLCVNACLAREQKILVALLGVSAARVLAHEDAPVEDRARAPVENAFVVLAARA